MIALAALVCAYAPLHPAGHRFGAASTPTQRSASALASAAASDAAVRGSLLKVVHQVTDPEAVASFYTGAFGLETLPTESAGKLLSTSGTALQLELVHAEGGDFTEGAGYRGLSLRVPNVTEAVAAATSHGGSVLEETEDVPHGPSNDPVEDDETITQVVEAVVADPGGFPVHLYEAAGADSSTLSGVRLDVHAWKRSTEWYTSEVGWKQLRWQSDVPRKAQLAVLLGGPGAEGVVGPVGAASDEQPSPLLTLRYVYGCAAKEGGSGLEALVFAAGDGSPGEMCDPDANPVRLE